MTRTVTIGTRGSQLALYQANLVKSLIEDADPACACEIKIIHTKGDKILDVALSKIGDKGLFTKELERALLEGEVDLCVHSTKDLPSALPEGLAILGMPARADARDAIIGNGTDMTIDSLPAGARVASGSLRRVAQLKRLRPDIEVCEMRGNVDTRVKRILSGEFDAGILAAAGVTRLGLTDAIGGFIGTDEMIPACGQGAIAIEARENDAETIAVLDKITDKDTLAAVTAERYVLGALEGGCQVPMGIHAEIADGVLGLFAFVSDLDGTRYVHAQAEGPATDPRGIGQKAVVELEAQGAREILASVLEAAR